ncbi:hypothetical protein CALVIDRAFT_556573 [Calocera viscosa TUFC12733]|uniref:Uncharacterized protein n=1 Tax=Calocera viscosa (strain TUFC12733) TaxID=1330018 RepID=A0A167JWC0_CALVF|nr:hypothetical protein CALVIDRAFT_556573 [Calocera viscosa TUFC12733]
MNCCALRGVLRTKLHSSYIRRENVLLVYTTIQAALASISASSASQHLSNFASAFSHSSISPTRTTKMLAFVTALTLAASSLALPTRSSTCYMGYGTVSIQNALYNQTIGYLSKDLLGGRMQVTQDVSSALTGSVNCPGEQSMIIQNVADAYNAVAAAAVYNTTMAAGSPNWALLTAAETSGSYTGAANVPNAWSDANNHVAAPSKSNIFTFAGSADSAPGPLNLTWQNTDGSTADLTAFVSNDGYLVGVTADFQAFLTVMGYKDMTPYATFTPVYFQMNGVAE